MIFRALGDELPGQGVFFDLFSGQSFISPIAFRNEKY